MTSLRDVVYSTKRERVYTDATTVGGIIIPLCKMKKWDIYLWGAGTDVSAIILYFWNLGIDIKGILDCDLEKEGKMILDRVPVIYPYNIAERFNSEKTFVIINTVFFKGIEQYEIMQMLNRLGITKFYELNEIEKKEMKAKPHPWADINRIDYYRKNIVELETTYNLLHDIRSKQIMLEFIRSYMQLGTYGLQQCSSDKKYFYGQNEDGSKEEIYKHLKNEVWVNCGSNIGDNIFWYFADVCGGEDTVYAYEGDKKIYERLVKNLEYLPVDYRTKVHPINEFIDEKTNWKEIEGRISLVNADIEGGELDLLKSMKNVIIESRPVLALCAYHKAPDLVELPKYIQSVVSNYYYVLRKYESNVDNIRRTSELVLYAIPEERIGDDL